MVTQHYEIEIAYRREQLLATRERVGPSRRQRRQAAALAAREQQAPVRQAPARPAVAC